jgi:hypothetical protein
MITKGNLQTCIFGAIKCPLEDLVRRTQESEAEVWNLVAHLVASDDFWVQTAVSAEFRVLLEHAFSAGYSQALSAGKHPDPHAASARYCPPCKATSFRRRIITVSARATAGHEDLVKDLAFLSLWMDAGQIGQIKLFVTNLLASNLSYCFTHSIIQVDCLDHLRLAELLKPILLSLHNREIQVGSIICDGAGYELKALDFSDRASIQAMNSGNVLFSRLLFIPCLCHRLNSELCRS